VVRPKQSLVARVLEEQRVKDWHALADECDRLRLELDTLRAELLELRNQEAR
jgi:hypothetical protein